MFRVKQERNGRKNYASRTVLVTIAAGILFDEKWCIRRCKLSTHIFVKESSTVHMTLNVALDDVLSHEHMHCCGQHDSAKKSL